MAQDVTIAGASYEDVPGIEVPKTGGGTSSFFDVSDTTATAADVASGKVFYAANGVQTVGTASGGGGSVEALTDEEVIAAVAAAWPTMNVSVTIHYRDNSGTTITGGSTTVALGIDGYATVNTLTFGGTDNTTLTLVDVESRDDYGLVVTDMQLPSYSYYNPTSSVTGSAVDGFNVTITYIYDGGGNN